VQLWPWVWRSGAFIWICFQYPSYAKYFFSSFFFKIRWLKPKWETTKELDYLAKLIKAAYDIFHDFSSAYLCKFSKIAYENSLPLIQKQFDFILSDAIEIASVSLYKRLSYHKKRLSYKLQISCLSKQGQYI
jgi:hypothetical protein